jgi:hypothetical protein
VTASAVLLLFFPTEMMRHAAWLGKVALSDKHRQKNQPTTYTIIRLSLIDIFLHFLYLTLRSSKAVLFPANSRILFEHVAAGD